jgi:hypothetical protein
MPTHAVPAIIDGDHIQLLGDAPVDRPYRVLVTFVAPVEDHEESRDKDDALLASFGAWQDDRPIEAMLADIYGARQSRSESPML